MSKPNITEVVNEHDAVEFIRRLGKRTAYERVLAVLAYCAKRVPNAPVDVGWACKIIENAGFGRPNITQCRAQLKSARGVRAKGASSYVMSADKVREMSSDLGLEPALEVSPAVDTPKSVTGAMSSDVCIVCALVEGELESVIAGLQLTKTAAQREDPSTYYEGVLRTTEGNEIRVAAAAATNMGLAASAILATKMILRYRPRLVAMPGIIGGTSQDGPDFGDIVIARQTIDYRAGKISQGDDGVLHFSGSSQPLSADTRLISVLEHSKNEIELVLASVKKKFPGNTPRSECTLRFGDVASGDQVVSSSIVVKEQLTSWRKLLGIEMETYAVHRACKDAVVPSPIFLSCKAISDSAQDKTSTWRKFAAHMSTQFLRHVLENYYKEIIG